MRSHVKKLYFWLIIVGASIIIGTLATLIDFKPLLVFSLGLGILLRGLIISKNEE